MCYLCYKICFLVLRLTTASSLCLFDKYIKYRHKMPPTTHASSYLCPFNQLRTFEMRHLFEMRCEILNWKKLNTSACRCFYHSSVNRICMHKFDVHLGVNPISIKTLRKVHGRPLNENDHMFSNAMRFLHVYY